MGPNPNGIILQEIGKISSSSPTLSSAIQQSFIPNCSPNPQCPLVFFLFNVKYIGYGSSNSHKSSTDKYRWAWIEERIYEPAVDEPII